MSNAICAICYEDARPLCEDLQSISACGHVFHELCLQQWMEYCPTGRKSTCPVCKQSCTVHDIHRLYFQSAESDSTHPQGSPSRNLQTAANDPEQADNASALRKLECQLAVAKTALQSREEQLKELDFQIASNLQRAEEAETANAVVTKELTQCKQVLFRVQKELRCCSIERTMLQEKHQAMATDLAAHKLIKDTDLSEEEIFRLSNLASGSNKNAIIEALTKSLILRNKSYKELMARCNELGMGESRALRKSEKTIEHLRKMKSRVQELEKLLEAKDNACLRGLNRGYSKTQGEYCLSAQRPSDQVASKRINTSRSSPLDESTSASTLSRGGDIALEKVTDNKFKLPGSPEDSDVMPRADLSDVQLPKIVKERGQMGVEHVQFVCPKNVNTSEENPRIRKRGPPEGATGLDHREDSAGSTTGFSNWIIKSKLLIQNIELLNNSRRRIDQGEIIREHPILAPSNAIQVSLLRPGPTSHPIENISSAVASSATCLDQFVLNPARVEHEVGTQSCTRITENSGHVNSPVVAPVNSFGAFSKRASSDRPSTSSSTFILSGADGRGGRVKVLRPPSLPQGVMAKSASQRHKKLKLSGAGSRSAQGGLQLEHFFEKAIS